MQEESILPGNSYNGDDDHGNQFNKLKPIFEFDKFNIRVEDFKTEVNSLLNQSSKTSNTIGLFELETANEAIHNALTIPDPKYVFDVLIQEKELIIFFGDAGIGKTIYAMQAAIDIAKKGYKVIFLDLELSKKQFQKRYTNEFGVPYQMPETLYRAGYSRIDEVPHDISYTDFFIDSLRELIDKTGAEVIFIDNLTKLAAGDTDSAKATIPIIEALNRLKTQYSLTIIAIEHNKKVDSSRPIQLNDLQGSKMKANLVDSIFTIGRSTKDKNLRYVKQVKVRDGELRYDTENVMLLEISKALGYLGLTFCDYASEYDHLKPLSEDNKQALIAQAKELRGQGKNQREIGKELGISLGTVNKYLRQ